MMRLCASTPANSGQPGSVWGHDLERAMHIAEQIASGVIWVNQHMAMAPFVRPRGAKESG